jgi:hypothetical protein
MLGNSAGMKLIFHIFYADPGSHEKYFIPAGEIIFRTMLPHPAPWPGKGLGFFPRLLYNDVLRIIHVRC